MIVNSNLKSGITFQGLKYRGANDQNPQKTGALKDNLLISRALDFENLIDRGFVNAGITQENGTKTVTFSSTNLGKFLLSVIVSPDEKKLTIVTEQVDPKKPNSGEKVVINCMERGSQLFYDLVNVLKKYKV